MTLQSVLMTAECDAAFRLLKEKLMENPILINPQLDKDYVIHCDASKYSYSGILQQTRPGTEELAPVAYSSGNFDKTQVKWNITEKEAYAIYKSVKKFAFYITGAKTTVFSDHKPLKNFFEGGMSIPKLDRWSLELQEFDISIEFIQGKMNTVADVISRLKNEGLYNEHSNEDHKIKATTNLKFLPIPKKPFDGICLDCVGPLERSKRNYKWILTCIDLHSSFMIAVPMKSKSADDIIHAYVETILPQIGPSRFILTDDGTEFKNDTMDKVLNRLNTEHKFTTVYFPRGNSRLENSHALLKRSISKYIDILDVEWDKCLNLATYAFNISPSSENCNSPYYIVYGREPVDAELQELEELHKYTGTNCGLKRLQQLSKIWKNHADELRRIRMH